MRAPLLLFTLLLFSATYSLGQTSISEEPLQDARQAVAHWTENQTLRLDGSTNHLIRPGVVADRLKQEVLIKGITTSVEAHEPIEFFLISPRSGHQYEALALSFALPSHVHEALEFIGLQPGRPIDPAILRTWPKGDRVLMAFSWSNRTVRAEDLIYHKGLHNTLPHKGFLFTGSIKEGNEYAADVEEPGSIASDYNGSQTVLDVPWRAQKEEVYATQIINPEIALPKETQIDITLRPADPFRRPADLTLMLHLLENHTQRVVKFSLEQAAVETPLVKEGDLHQVIAEISRLDKKHRDPYLTVIPDENLQLQEVHSVYAFLRSMESENGIRLEPEPEPWLNHILWYPPNALTNTQSQAAEPMNIFFEQATNGWQAVAIFHDIDYDEEDRATTNTLRHVLSQPGGLKPALESFNPLIPVTLVYAEGHMRYGTWLKWMKEVRQEFPETFLVIK